MGKLIASIAIGLLITAVPAAYASADSVDVPRPKSYTAFKGDTAPGAVQMTAPAHQRSEATISSVAYMFYNCDIWFNYVWQMTNESSVEGWAWTEVHETSSYSSPLVQVDSIYANQRLWKDSTLIDSDLHSAISNSAWDDADVYRGGCSATDPMLFWFHSTSYHGVTDSYYGSAYATDSDDF